jgi:Spy/CpxP family protein refolding chaperone
MHRLTHLASAAALALALALAGASDARPPMAPRGGPPDDRGGARMIDEHAEELGLDDEQRQAIRAIVDESRAEAEELHQQLRDAHKALRDLLEQESPNEAAVMKQAEKIGSLETAMHKHRLGALLRVRAVLTPEQREQLTRLRDEVRDRRRAPALEACDDELASLCPEAEDPRDRMQCLRDHREELSEGCRTALRRGPRGGPGGRPKGPGGMP